MCAAVVLALILFPIFGAALAYAHYVAIGGWIGGLAGGAVALLLGAGPIVPLLSAEKRRLEQERADRPPEDEA